jgi:nickel-dependent lactate racemase
VTYDTPVIGRGASELDLSPGELRETLDAALAEIPAASRVLAIISDKTRDDNTDLLFPLTAQILERRGVAQFDALVAQGTHPPMTEREKRAKIGAAGGQPMPVLGRVFDHRWDREDELVTLGTLGAEHVRRVTQGLLDGDIPVRLNRLLAPGLYDTVLIFGATVPHEVAGFAGGAKYFFPGVAGPDLTHRTHWLSALATVQRVIGRVETPTRHLIEAAAALVRARVISINSVVRRDEDGRLRTHALFAGDVRGAFRRAAEVSRGVHIKYTHRTYKRVVALLDEHYDDLWVGGKASYRLGAIVEPGGELLIYGPHMRCISETHGELIERYGYAPLETMRERVKHSVELQKNLCVAAHLTHVTYAESRDAQGRIVPKYRITLATEVDEATCRRVNLGFMDHRTFCREAFESDADTLVVERAGSDLYLVEPRD